MERTEEQIKKDTKENFENALRSLAVDLVVGGDIKIHGENSKYFNFGKKTLVDYNGKKKIH